MCWALFIPYPCRKTVTKYCCRGVHKYRTFIIFVVEHYFCCDGHEHHWWSLDLSLNLPYWVIDGDAEVCKDSRPEESEGCPETVGDAPPEGAPSEDAPSQPGQQPLVQVGGGASAGAIIAALVAALATGGAQQAGVAALAGAIVGAVFGAGTGRRWGCATTIVVLLIVLVFLWLMYWR